MRDDFSQRTKDIVAERGAYHCSNPDCNALTVGPHSNSNRSAKVGVAAHICAASPGGPRYSAEMSIEQRQDGSNAIWLCANCSTLIDKDAEGYPVELLHIWRRTHEERVMSCARTFRPFSILRRANVVVTARVCTAGKTAYGLVEFQVENNSAYPVNVSKLRLHVIETFKLMLFGSSRFSRVYDICLMPWHGHNSVLKLPLCEVVQPESRETFRVVISAKWSECLICGWQFQPLLTIDGRTIATNRVDVWIPGQKDNMSFDEFKGMLRPKVKEIVSEPDPFGRKPKELIEVHRRLAGGYATTIKAFAFCWHTGPTKLVNDLLYG